MSFNALMINAFNVYRNVARQFALGFVDAATFLEAHKLWNEQVEKWEEEHSADTNYGAF